MSAGLDLLTDLGDLYDTVVEESDLSDRSDPGSGRALLRVDRFGFSANNITYAALGNTMGYWSFFPAREGCGRVPVWGFADVIASRVEGVVEGDRFFGYVPPSTHVLLEPADVSSGGFVDASAQRSALPPAYNGYVNTATDPGYEHRHEPLIALLRPLFTTAFLLDDYLSDNDWMGSDAIVITSASSKTSFLLADLLGRHRERPAIVGLTSEANRGFVEGLGSYDRVLAYGDATTLPVAPTAIIDVAGDSVVIDDLHTHLEASVTYSGIIGLSHFDPDSPPDVATALADSRRSLFFAPDQLAKRVADWGEGEVARRSAEVWGPVADHVSRHLNIVYGHGPDSVRRVYEEVIRGSTTPDTGHVLSLWGDD